MNQVKGKILRIAILLSLAVVVISFNSNTVSFDGGTIHTPNIIVTGNSTPVILSATTASGCTSNVAYQWQQSMDNVDFVNISSATDSSYQAIVIMPITYFRRKATCGGIEQAFTNVATITVQAP